MKAEIEKIVYITGVPSSLMDKVRSEKNTWAEGEENLCLNFECAMEIEEIAPLLEALETNGGCDVILSL